MKKLVMLILVFGLLAGCGSTPPPVDQAGETKQNLEKVSVMLDWYPNAVHAFLYTAIAEGYFAKQGIEVDIKMPAETNDPLRLVASGEVDLALSYQPQVIMARGEGIPVQSVAAVVRHPLNYLMIPEESPIQSPKDLMEKKVGYPAIPLNDALVKTMVEHDGGDFSRVEMIDVGWDLIPAISTNKVDALSGGFINHEFVLLEKEGQKMRAVNPTEYGVPDYYELVLVSGEAYIRDNLPLIKKFWEAAVKGQGFVRNHPEQGLKYLLEHENDSFPLEEDVEEKSLQTLLPLMNEEGQPFGAQTEESWQEVADWLYENGLVKEEIDVKLSFVDLLE